MSIRKGSDIIAGTLNTEAYVDKTSNQTITGKKAFKTLHLSAEDSNIEGGQLVFDSAPNEPNTGKSVIIDRYSGYLRFLGTNSSGTTRVPLQINMQDGQITTNTNVNHKGSINWFHNDNGCRIMQDSITYTATPSSNIATNIGIFDKNGAWMGGWEHSNESDGTNKKQMAVRRNNTETYATLGVAINNSSMWSYAPTMDIGCTNNEIVTANSLRNLIKSWGQSMTYLRNMDLLYSGSIGAGTISLNGAYTNYAWLLVDGANDNGGNRNFYPKPTWCISTAISRGITWTLWENGCGNYWICTSSSTSTSFVNSGENSVIYNIWGLNP